MPASRPFAGLLRKSTLSPLQSKSTVLFSTGRAFSAFFAGISAVSPSENAAHRCDSGHLSQCGFPFGMHTVAPTSIIA